MRETVLFVLLFLVPFQIALQGEKVEQRVEVGKQAPDFALPYATKEKVELAQPWKLSENLGKHTIVLAFYPADWSPGCTKEVCTFRDNFKDLASLNVLVVGVSGDYVFSHHAWARAENLPFILLSDHAHEVAKLYLSYDEKTGFNKRTIFVIDKKGIIRYRDLEYSVSDEKDFEELKKALKKIR
ncbi:MAG: redoxin domain-containing protein [bacterium JZ-2024 1]